MQLPAVGQCVLSLVSLVSERADALLALLWGRDALVDCRLFLRWSGLMSVICAPLSHPDIAPDCEAGENPGHF